MAKYKLSVQFAGSGRDRLNNKVNGRIDRHGGLSTDDIDIYPNVDNLPTVDLPAADGKKERVATGNYFHGSNAQGEQVFSIGGVGSGTSERAEFEKQIVAANKELAEAAQNPGTNVSALTEKIENLKNERRHYSPQHATVTSAADSGVNSTENAAKIMTVQVDAAMQKLLKEDPEAEIELDIQGGSRGAVAASKFARNMNALYRNDNRVSATLMQADPVPGGLPGQNNQNELYFSATDRAPNNSELVVALASSRDRAALPPEHFREAPTGQSLSGKSDAEKAAAWKQVDRGIIKKHGVSYSLELSGVTEKFGFDPQTVTGADVVIIERLKHFDGYSKGDQPLHYEGAPKRNGEILVNLNINQKDIGGVPNGVYCFDGNTYRQAKNPEDIKAFVGAGHCSDVRKEIVSEVGVQSFTEHKDSMEKTRAESVSKLEAQRGAVRSDHTPEPSSDQPKPEKSNAMAQKEARGFFASVGRFFGRVKGWFGGSAGKKMESYGSADVAKAAAATATEDTAKPDAKATTADAAKSATKADAAGNREPFSASELQQPTKEGQDAEASRSTPNSMAPKPPSNVQSKDTGGRKR